MPKRSSHQQKVIKNFYDNREAISLQKLSEKVTDLYLAEGRRREQIWKWITAQLKNLGLKPERIEHLRKQDNPELIAKVVEEFMNKS